VLKNINSKQFGSISIFVKMEFFSLVSKFY